MNEERGVPLWVGEMLAEEMVRLVELSREMERAGDDPAAIGAIAARSATVRKNLVSLGSMMEIAGQNGVRLPLGRPVLSDVRGLKEAVA